MEEEEETEKKPEFFQGQGVSLGSENNTVHYGKPQIRKVHSMKINQFVDPTGGVDDPDLLKVMQLSMKDVSFAT